MMQTLIVRLKNKKVLLSLFSGIILILTNTGVIDVTMSHNWEVTVNTILGILVALGVVSDPDSHTKLPDEEVL